MFVLLYSGRFDSAASGSFRLRPYEGARCGVEVSGQAEKLKSAERRPGRRRRVEASGSKIFTRDLMWGYVFRHGEHVGDGPDIGAQKAFVLE